MIGSPGAQLSAARVQAGLSVSQAAEQLHLDLATLDALENSRFESMGASVYVRGHLRRYAQLVNIPEAQIMTAYDGWAGRLAPQPDLREVITAAAARSGSQQFIFRPRSAVIGVIVLVPLALIWWAVREPARSRSEKAPTVSSPPAANLQPPVTLQPAPAAPPAPVSTTVLPAPASTAALDSLQHPDTNSATRRVFLSGPMATFDLQDRPVELFGSSAARLRHFTESHAVPNAVRLPASLP